MKHEIKPASIIRAEKEKLVMENFASVMKKLDATFLIEDTDVSTKKNSINESDDKLDKK